MILLDSQRKRTKLRPGDQLIYHRDHRTVIFIREGGPRGNVLFFRNPSGDLADKVLVELRTPLAFEGFVEVIAAVAGLHYEFVEKRGHYETYRFIKNS